MNTDAHRFAMASVRPKGVQTISFAYLSRSWIETTQPELDDYYIGRIS